LPPAAASERIGAMKRLPNAIYGRTSTSSRQDIEGQLKLCRKAAGAGAVEFVDRSTSSTVEDRKGVTELVAAAAAGLIGKVFISELSRLGRSIGFICRTVERLAESGVKVVLAKTGTVLDPSTLEGRALLGGLALAADIELCLIRERNARGRETIRTKHIKVGRRPANLDPQILSLAVRDGLSQRQIAGKLHSSPATVQRHLKKAGFRYEKRVIGA